MEVVMGYLGAHVAKIASIFDEQIVYCEIREDKRCLVA